MKVQRVEQKVITHNHPKYKIIDEMSFNSKNLYNEANYVLRQEFINNGNYISYYDMNKEFKTHENYKACGSQPANCTLRLLDKNWKSYFRAIKDWKEHPEKYLGMPKLPKYLPKDGRFNWMIPNNQCYFDKEKGEIHFSVLKLQGYHWKSRCIGRLIQVRFVPRGNNYVMEAVYEVEIEDKVNGEMNRVIAIDLGVDNFATVTNNIGLNPFIINGKPLKSINQFYNKRLAKEKSELMKRNGLYWSNKLDSINFKRHKRVKDYIHKSSAYIVKWCVKNNIDTIIVGKNKKWKQNKDNMQNFVFIPYDIFIEQLEYKCENVGIRFIKVEESYTSGTSFLDNEEPCRDNYNKDRRIYRGLFESNNGLLINADVNGSYQIMEKVIPNAIDRYGIEAILTPMIINII